MAFWSANNLELYILLIIFLTIITIIYFYNRSTKTEETTTTESFSNYYHLNGCPPGYKSFYNTDGNITCCNGEIIANKCLADKQCTLNGPGSKDMPNCVFSLLDMYTEKGKSFCPSSMTQYFEAPHNVKACTEGRLNSTLDGPQNASQPYCLIYNTWDDNKNNKDSCFNQRQLDNFKCFGDNCTKELVKPVPTAPPLVAIGFTDSSGMHRVAYSRESLSKFLDVVNPNWKNTGMDLSVNINVAEVAKAYYIDKTIDQSQIQF